MTEKRTGWGSHEEKNLRKVKRNKEEVSSKVIIDMGGHPEQVFNWRKDGFLHLGWKNDDAEFLARTKIDMRRAETMLVQGASHSQVERILIGTCFAGEDETWGTPVPPDVEEESDAA